MLVATPGQTTAYVLHSNNNNSSSGNTTTTANNPTASAVTSANTAAALSSSSSSVVTTKKQQAVLSKSSSSVSKQTPKCINNINNTLSTTKSIQQQPTKTLNSTTAHQNNYTFHVPSNKRDSNNIVKNSMITNSAASKIPNNQQQQHSLNNSSGTSRPPSFLSALKDTVQKALVTTASSLSRNGSNRTTALNSSSNSTSNNTSSTSLHVTSSSASTSSLSVAANKNYSTTAIITSVASTAASSSASSSTILPLTVARKKFAQAIATQPKLHTIPPTILHRYPEERQKASSTDSLQKEMCHFKPIRTVPTTPWKSGSKSRGSSLRFPKANLATNKTEFILKSNCDVNNRKRKQQTTKQTQNDQELVVASDAGGNGDDNDEQENKAYYEMYKPKPSSLHLSVSFLTQNHQSAFVCLVANLMNIQSTTTSSHTVKGDNNTATQKSKSPRVVERSKGSAVAAAKATSPTLPVKEIIVRHKKFKSPLPPPPLPAKRTKLSTPATRSQRCFGKATPTSNAADTESSELLAKLTPSRRKLKGAKSIMTNTEQLVKEEEKSLESPAIDAGEKTAKVTGQRSSRKRKATPDDNRARTSIFTPLKGSHLSASPSPISRSSTVRARRSVRLTAETYSSNIYFKYPEINFSRAKLQVPSQRNATCFSPPLTRSRLKQLLREQQSQKETTATTSVRDVKKRKG